MRNSSTRPFPGVFIPPEAEPYCDSRGIIDWQKVAAKLGLNASEYWGYELSQILKGIQDDDHGVLQAMRALKLDCIVNSLMTSNRRGSTDLSHQRAIKYAEDFDIPLGKVPGTGPDGLVLKRDVVAYHRFLKAGNINALPSPSAVIYPAADAENLERLHGDLKTSLDEQVRLLAQRRRLAVHLREALKKRRLAEGAVSVMNDQVRQARAATEAAEQRLDHSEQMQESLTEDLKAAYSYRGSAVARAIAAESRAASAEKALTIVLNAHAQRSTIFSHLWSRLVSRTSEVTA